MPDAVIDGQRRGLFQRTVICVVEPDCFQTRRIGQALRWYRRNPEALLFRSGVERNTVVCLTRFLLQTGFFLPVGILLTVFFQVALFLEHSVFTVNRSSFVCG